MIGAGTVGSGVIKLLRQNRALVEQRAGCEIVLKRVADKDLRPRRGVGLRPGLLTNRVKDVLADPSVDIVVELIGGLEPARQYILEALRHGKHVVTANKAVLAKHWDEILGTAKRASKDIYFESSVAGGIPLLRSLHDGLSANRIKSIWGIVNGTTNYILSEMRRRRIEYPVALAEARKKGYAEQDPSFDINGIDAAHKLSILVAIAFNQSVPVEKIYTEGISRITRQDMVTAEEEFGQVIKPLAIAQVEAGELDVRVHPALIPKKHPIAGLDGCLNGVHFIGDAVGAVMFQGQGAGQMCAASAVVGDIIYLARNIRMGVAGKVPFIYYKPNPKPLPLRQIGKIESRYYLRFTVVDKPGVLSAISGVLGSHRISIASAIQKENQRGQKVPVVMTTCEAREADIRKALQKIDRLPVVKDKTLLLRMARED